MAKQTGIVDNGKLYAYRLPGEKKFFDFALKVDPDYHGFKGICFVSPPRHPHMIKGKLGKKTATGFTFIADKDAYAPGEWEFVELPGRILQNLHGRRRKRPRGSQQHRGTDRILP